MVSTPDDFPLDDFPGGTDTGAPMGGGYDPEEETPDGHPEDEGDPALDASPF